MSCCNCCGVGGGVGEGVGEGVGGLVRELVGGLVGSVRGLMRGSTLNHHPPLPMVGEEKEQLIRLKRDGG